MSLEQFVRELIARYPEGSTPLETQLGDLKRKLNEDDFSDADEEEYSKMSDIASVNACIVNSKKMKLDDEEFSSADEEGYYKLADCVEQTSTKSKVNTENRAYVCAKCHKHFLRKQTLTRHILTHNSTFKCKLCIKQFRRQDSLHTHLKRVHKDTNSSNKCFICKHCGIELEEYSSLIQHIEEKHPLSLQSGGRIPPTSKTLHGDTKSTDVKSSMNSGGSEKNQHGEIENQHIYEQQNAIENGVQDRMLFPKNEEKYDMLTLFANCKEEVLKFLHSRLQQHGIKWYLSVQVELVKETPAGEIEAISNPHFRSLTYSTTNVETLSDHDIDESFHKISKSLEAYLRDSSGWIVRKVIHLKIHTVLYTPLHGSSFIPLPETLKRSNSILNIENSDQKCFVYSILASLHPVESKPELVSHYLRYESELSLKNIKFPVSINQIDTFESENKYISLNVFTFQDNDILPLKISRHKDRHHVNLLLLQNENNSHYCLIKDLNRFLSRLKSSQIKRFACNHCLHMFTKQYLLDEHIPYCSVHGAQKVEYPKPENSILEFQSFEKQLKVPFVIYADFETLNRPLSYTAESNTTQTTLLTPCSFGYKVVSTDPTYTKPAVIYRGSDAAQKLIECLLKEKREIEDLLQDIKPLIMNEENEKEFNKAMKCCICNKQFNATDQKARHHDHFTGKYLGATHMNCNLQCKQADFIPVIFHGLRNFDAHCLCQSIGAFKTESIKVIPYNLEKYVSFSLGKLRFIDSFQFMSASLEALVKDLSVDGVDAFPNMQNEFPIPEQLNMLLRKGSYPYDYMTNESIFLDTKLPPQEAFYSNIKREGISDEDYTHAKTVFRTFKHQTMADYHDLYLRTDVVLLSDVFEQFRGLCLDLYDLDPAHFYTSPGLSWQALLKKTGVCLELITDPNMYLFFEKGIRGGISGIFKRHRKANNPRLPDYNPSQPTSFIQFVDANNLYGYAMSQKLPTGYFRFLEKDEIDKFDVLTIPSDGPIGYVFEVDLKYPEHIHDEHNAFPLAPESREISNEMLSPYCKRIWKQLHKKGENEKLPPRAKVKKLLTTLNHKEKYVVHYKTLQLYLQLGMELKSIHRILEFQQNSWMDPFIRFNTEMRKKARSPFQRNLFKLLNNAVFGKTMENVRAHKDVHLCHQKKRLIKLTAKSTYKGHKVFSEDLAAIELQRAKVLLNKPVYVGFSVLELSKEWMYRFWYMHLKRMYGSKLELCMADTDSFLFYCETEDFFEDMKHNLHLYDTSDFPKDHRLYSEQNRKRVGMFKSETADKCISEFVGLRSKMYAFCCESKEQKRAKGISKVTVEKDIRLQHYKDALLNETQHRSSMHLIRSHNHKLYVERVEKLGISPMDDKRFLLEDGINSLAYGHYKINM